MYNIISKRFRFFALSGALILVSLISLAVFGLQPGIEFSSGTLLTVRFAQPVDIAELRVEMTALGYPSAVVQSTGSGDFQIRLGVIDDSQKDDLEAGLADAFGELTETGITRIEPTISRQTVRTVIIAVSIAAVGILAYVTYAFRRMPKPIRYGTCAIAALAFDLLIVVGLFALIAGLLEWEVNLMFITGLLAVIGYSVNDKIVIFDRIRENARKMPSANFATVVNTSLIETLTRSVITGLCTLFTIIALMLFVGSNIQTFLAVLFIGIVAGTYSSILVSAPLLVVWENREWKRFLPWVAKSDSVNG
jgi:preprotein translocase subunit SecF